MIDNFGCVPPPDIEHRRRYPLEAGSISVGPMVAGMNWPAEFSRPVRRPDGTYWVDAKPPFSRIIGGHAVCLIPEGWQDVPNGWTIYNQGPTSQCVAFSSSRVQAIYNKKFQYAPAPLYERCKQLDGWPGNGTYVRVAMDVMRREGLWLAKAKTDAGKPKLAHGILSNRWATSPDDILDALDARSTGRVTILNSWGPSYPERVYIPIETIAAMMSANGYYFEATMVTDRPGPLASKER